VASSGASFGELIARQPVFRSASSRANTGNTTLQSVTQAPAVPGPIPPVYLPGQPLSDSPRPRNQVLARLPQHPQPPAQPLAQPPDRPVLPPQPLTRRSLPPARPTRHSPRPAPPPDRPAEAAAKDDGYDQLMADYDQLAGEVGGWLDRIGEGTGRHEPAPTTADPAETIALADRWIALGTWLNSATGIPRDALDALIADTNRGERGTSG
jgi:hypothetical protein